MKEETRTSETEDACCAAESPCCDTAKKAENLCCDTAEKAESPCCGTAEKMAEAEELADRIAIIRKGKIVASGTTLELRRQMLGPKIFEVRFAQEYDLVEIQNLATIADFKMVDVQRNFIQFTSENPNEVNPQVLDYFHQIDVQVVYLHEVIQSLERIYLQAVSEPIVQ